MDVFLAHTPNPFFLLPPSSAWLRNVAAYDADLRVFPSQTRGVYRVARVRRLMPIDHRKYRPLIAKRKMHPDSCVALEHNLVFINWCLVGDVMVVDPLGTLFVETLRRRDTTAVTRKLGSDSDQVAERVEALEAEEEAATDQAFRDRTRQIGRAARLAVLYRTGQRVSLHIPLKAAKHSMAPSSPSFPPAPPA